MQNILAKTKFILLSAIFFFSACTEKVIEQQHWRFAIEEIEGSIQDQYAKEFKKRIEEKTKGKVKVTIYPYGTLGTSDQISELIATGALQFAMASPGFIGKTIPELQVFSLPFILPEELDETKKLLNKGSVIPLLESLYDDKGFKLLAFYPEGWQAWTTNKKITSPKDFNGFKMRVMTSPLLLSTFESYGASPVGMPYSEVYSALQLNMIDGQVNPVFAIEEMSFFEVSDYMIFPKDSQFITSAITSKRFFENLSKEEQVMIESLFMDLQDFIFDLQKQVNAERLETIKEKKPNLNIITLNDKQRNVFQERSKIVRKQYLDIGGKKADEVLKALLKDKQEFASDVD